MTSPGPGAAPDTTEGTVIDLDEVVALLTGMGVAAVVEQTGGGCATIFAGPTRPHPFEPGCLAHAAVAGPGRYGWGQRPSVAALAELVIGPDDCGDTRPTDAALVGARDEAAVARLIAEQATHPDRPATDAELTEAGFDPAPARAARERAATLAARWCPPIRGDAPDDDTAGGMVVAEQLVTVAVENGALRVGVHVAPSATGLLDHPSGCVPIVVEVEGEAQFSLDEHGHARVHGYAAEHLRQPG